MAIWGIGAYYKASINKNKIDDFLNSKAAFIGWDEIKAPAIHKMFASIKVGDIIYIKSVSTRAKKLHIKAIGIVTDISQIDSADLGKGISVLWKENFLPFQIEITKEIYKNNVFNNALYEEFNQTVSDLIIENII